MPTYTVKLNDRKPVADGTTAFHFEKPSGFMYKPGQFIELTAINPEETDAEGNTRAFSLASAPSEDFLMVTTRMRDTAFKRVFAQLKPGEKVLMQMRLGKSPHGSFELQEAADTARPAAAPPPDPRR